MIGVFGVSEGDDFDLGAAMAALGVKRIDKGREAARKRPIVKKQSKAVANVRPSQSSNTEDKAGLLNQALKNNDALTLELTNTKDILKTVRAQHEQLKLENEALKTALLESNPVVTEHSEDEGAFSAIFRERGLRGRSEYIDLFKDLMETQRLFDILPDTLSKNPNSLRHMLNSRIVLSCKGDHCSASGPVSFILVAPERCEICGGSNKSSEPLQDLSENLMLNGITKVAVVTSMLALAKALKASINQRIDLTILPVGSSGDLVKNQQLVIDWGGHRPSAFTELGGTVLLRSKSSTIMDLSKRVCSYLNKLDR